MGLMFGTADTVEVRTYAPDVCRHCQLVKRHEPQVVVTNSFGVVSNRFAVDKRLRQIEPKASLGYGENARTREPRIREIKNSKFRIKFRMTN
ncbi:hypothetical protein DU53_03410 [Kosmotoga sp. DU53]|nr:hypothetical protein DU53_03410 [Kosmotoga sp. DU53]